MANNVIGWTERTPLDPSTTSNWTQNASTLAIYNERNTGKGSVITHDIPANKLSQFEFKLDVDTSDAGQGGAIVFYVNDDGSEYYAITWKMEWSKTTFYLAKDNSTTGGDSTLIETFELTTVNNSEGAQKIAVIVKVEAGLLSFDCNSLDNDQHGNWQYSLTSTASYTTGYVGLGSYNGWDSSRFTYYFKELNELAPQPSTPRPRFWIIS